MQKLLGLVRKAVTDYNMIQDGDHIAVGLSGGKDSIVLLALLSRYQKFAKESFTLSAINVDMNFPETDKKEVDALVAYCQKIGVPLHIVDTNLADVLFNQRKENRPCSLCSKIRRGALNSKADEIGANKIALGHHVDDALETLFLSLTREGRLSTFSPISYMSRMDKYIIRPMIYIEERQIANCREKYKLPVVYNPCPMDKHSEREYVKRLISSIDRDVKDAKLQMIRALINPERNNLWDKYKGKKDIKSIYSETEFNKNND